MPLPKSFESLFNHCRVINLESRPERWESFKVEATKANLPMQKLKHFKAVDGNKYSHSDDIGVTKDTSFNYGWQCSNWDAMTKGQIGCALSHYHLLQEIVKYNLPYMLVFEDDVVFCDHFLERASLYYRKTLKTGLDVLHLGHDNNPDEYGYGVKKISCFCTHAILYTNSGARKILNYIQKNGLYVIDILIKTMQMKNMINYYIWLAKPTENELQTKSIKLDRSFGLVFQSNDFDSDVGNENSYLDYYNDLNLTPLCNIMNECGSDKGNLLWNHQYTQYYYSIFKDLEPTRVFELGLGSVDPNIPSNMTDKGTPCASLNGWKQFFPRAKVYGADIDKKILNFKTTFHCDQTDPESILKMWSQNFEDDELFDIIIEDGLHCHSANVCFFKNSIHKLQKPNGIYIIEDVHMDNARLWSGLCFPGYHIEVVHIIKKDSETNLDNYLIKITHRKENE